ncbi:alpha/beta hydrolase [Natrialbaceae archaeon A-CW2]|uniref:alpha/beta hydrolase n=1 Tax=Natronosalvus amylolyticus TaxID=2961994 RepID=UPI0020C96289|nr:alpha/beta hydrolase [Natronosalvus amylolyticus]
MSSNIAIPGARDVRATLDEPPQETDAVVVACPPHPQHGGNRTDRRLVAVSDALTSNEDRPIACLRIDYGPWDQGRGELEDVTQAVSWASERYDHVGLFGFSFGSALALLAAATIEIEAAIDAVAALAPPSRLGPDLDVLAALEELSMPALIAYGVRDTTVDWEPVVERAGELGHRRLELSADHFFVGQHESVADEIRSFFIETVALEGRDRA